MATKNPNPAAHTVTAQLYALFDKVGVESLSVNMARAIAEAHKLNTTSAEISFYRWRELRGVPTKASRARKAKAKRRNS